MTDREDFAGRSGEIAKNFLKKKKGKMGEVCRLGGYSWQKSHTRPLLGPRTH